MICRNCDRNKNGEKSGIFAQKGEKTGRIEKQGVIGGRWAEKSTHGHPVEPNRANMGLF